MCRHHSPEKLTVRQLWRLDLKSWKYLGLDWTKKKKTFCVKWEQKLVQRTGSKSVLRYNTMTRSKGMSWLIVNDTRFGDFCVAEGSVNQHPELISHSLSLSLSLPPQCLVRRCLRSARRCWWRTWPGCRSAPGCSSRPWARGPLRPTCWRTSGSLRTSSRTTATGCRGWRSSSRYNTRLKRALTEQRTVLEEDDDDD